ncbi:hypothetical protein WDU94_000631 [Cyamophila willieti]
MWKCLYTSTHYSKALETGMNSVVDCLKQWRRFIPGGEVWEDNFVSNEENDIDINKIEIKKIDNNFEPRRLSNEKNIDQMGDNIGNGEVHPKESKKTNIDSNGDINNKNEDDMNLITGGNIVVVKHVRPRKRKLPEFLNMIIDFMYLDKSDTLEKAKQIIPGIEALDDNFLPSTGDNTKNTKETNDIEYNADIIYVKRRKPSTLDNSKSKIFSLTDVSCLKNFRDRLFDPKERQELPMVLYVEDTDLNSDEVRNIDINIMNNRRYGENAEKSETHTWELQETTDNKKTTNELENAVKTLENLFNAVENKKSGSILNAMINQNHETLCAPTKIDIQYELSVKYGNVTENCGNSGTGFLVYAYKYNSETDLHKEIDNGLGSTGKIVTKLDDNCSTISTLYCNTNIGENSKTTPESKSLKLKTSKLFKIVEEIESRSKLALEDSNLNLKYARERHKNSKRNVVENLENEPLAQNGTVECTELTDNIGKKETKAEYSEQIDVELIDLADNVSDDVFYDIDADTIDTNYYPVNNQSPRYQHVKTLAEKFEEVAKISQTSYLENAHK